MNQFARIPLAGALLLLATATAGAQSPLPPTPEEILDRAAKAQFGDHLHYFNELDKGGHFAAFEQPETFVAEIRSAFRALR